MNKWIGPTLSLLVVLLIILISGPFHHFKAMVGKEKENGMVRTQYGEKGEKKGGTDSNIVLILKEFKETVEGWLKSLNERIEREDITRFEVRFLEILRSILEWVKEKIDSWIESSEDQVPGKKRRDLFREAIQRISPLSQLG
jgi:hypothetical protein